MRHIVPVLLAPCAAVMVIAGCGTGSLQAAAERVKALGHPTIVSVTYDVDWFDGDSLFVDLVPGATAADAKAVWCDAVIPAYVPDGTSIFVGPESPVIATAEEPADCSDPSDMPPLVPWDVN